MAFKSSELHDTEQLVLDLHPHPITLFRSVVALTVSIIFGLWVSLWWRPEGTTWAVFRVIIAAAVIGALIYFIVQWVNLITQHFVITTDRCIFRQGVFAKSGVEIPLERINTIFFRQTVLERMVGCGSLALESAGERGTETIEHVRNPVKVQHVIYKQIEDNENRKFDRIGVNNPGLGASAPSSTADEIAKLASLLEQGHLSQEEFEAQKAALLAGGNG